jgi:hypothetical protein
VAPEWLAGGPTNLDWINYAIDNPPKADGSPRLVFWRQLKDEDLRGFLAEKKRLVHKMGASHHDCVISQRWWARVTIRP